MSPDDTGFDHISFRRNLVAVRTSFHPQLLALGILTPAQFLARCADGAPLGGGRGGAVILTLPGGDRIVVRPYRHGGILGPILGTRYTSPARALRELNTHNAAYQAGVPVPEPLAAIAYAGPIFTQLHLIVRHIPNAPSLEQWLRENPNAPRSRRDPIITAVAVAIGKLFAAHIYHPDLHPGNILIQNPDTATPAAYIIDFDRASICAPLPTARRDEMLFRFNRALVKRNLADRLPLRDRLRHCRRFGIAADPAALRRFTRDCAAHLRRHHWHY